MDRRRFLAIGVTAGLLATGCGRLLASPDEPPETDGPPEPEPDTGRDDTGAAAPDAGDDETPDDEPAAEDLVDPQLREATPTQWGETVDGVSTRIDTTDALVALTFDACGGAFGSGYDEALITFLREQSVAATLFVNARWIDEHPRRFEQLAADPLFEIANHGTRHVPLSVDGRSVYGIDGTASVDEAIDEVMGNQRKITELTGIPPRHFRSGTAYYDDVAVRIVHDLGLEVAGFDVLGDAGATFSASQVEAALMTSRAGSIVLLHMNQPSSGTAAGVAAAVPQLRERGMEFVTLGDRPLV